MKKKNLDSMSIKALEEYNQELMANKRRIKDEQKAVTTMLNKKYAQAKINKSIESMSPTERDALKDALNGDKAQ